MNADIHEKNRFVDYRWGFSIMTVSILWFHLVHRFIGYFCVPSVIESKGKSDVWRWNNLLLSWVHALIVGSWDLLCFYFYPELLDDLINFKNPFCYYVVVMSTSYFFYDFADMLLHNKAFKLWEVTLHHIAVLMIFVYNLRHVTCIGFTVVALLCEVSSFFLHSRKLLLMLSAPQHQPRLYQTVAAINMIGFVLFRGYSIMRINYAIVFDRNAFSVYYHASLCVSMFVMSILNFILGWIVCKNDYFPFKREKVNGHVPNGVSHPPKVVSNGSVVPDEPLDSDKLKDPVPPPSLKVKSDQKGPSDTAPH